MSIDVQAVLQSRYGVAAHQRERLFSFVQLVREAPLNLTAWTGEELWTRGVFESLDLGESLGAGSAIQALDIGSGGGFPGVVLAIAYPSWTWTLLDARARRVEFLRTATQKLELDNVKVVAARAENWIRETDSRQGFQVVTMRAVAPLRVSLELGLPYVSVGGALLLAQGKSGRDDLLAAESFVVSLGGRVESWISHAPTRATVVVRKVRPTPLQFPRTAKVLGKEE